MRTMRIDPKIATPSPATTAVRRSALKHQRILEVAGDLALELGFANVTIEQIARRASVGKQTVYRWWPNKAALYVEVYSTLVPETVLRPQIDDVRTGLTRLLEELFLRLRKTAAGPILAGLIAEAQGSDEMAEALRKGLIVGRRRILEEPLRRAADLGDLRSGLTPGFAAEISVGLVWQRVLTDRTRLNKAFATEIVALIMRPS